MPAVVRVKRRIDEEPLSAFVLNGKKRRIEGSDAALVQQQQLPLEPCEVKEETISTVLKFAGTINKQDDQATKRLARLNKEAAQQLVKEKTRKNVNHTERARQEMRQTLHENRFRIVNCMRSNFNADDDAAQTTNDAQTTNATKSTDSITIVDIEKQTATNITTANNDNAIENNATNAGTVIAQAQTTAANELATVANNLQPADSDAGYVYDLYLPDDHQQVEDVDLMDDNYLSLRALDVMIFEKRFSSGSESEMESEDSNNENYFTNDYPDKSDDSENMSMDELAMCVNKVFLDENETDDDSQSQDYYSSSDDDDDDDDGDGFVHSVKTTDPTFVHDVDDSAFGCYGSAYDRFKARIMKKKFLKLKKQETELDNIANDDDKEKSNSDLNEID